MSVVIDPTQPIDFNIVGESLHVVAYRIWVQRPGGSWEHLEPDGHTGDSIPDHHVFGPVPSGSVFAYWLGIGRVQGAGTTYRAVVTLGQGGKLLASGTFIEQDKTDANGTAMVRRKVTLQ